MGAARARVEGEGPQAVLNARDEFEELPKSDSKHIPTE